MPSLSDAQSFNASVHFNYTPVAVFLGGTGGIAASTAELLARYTEGRIHVIIAGRNRTDGTKVLNSLVRPLKYRETETDNSDTELLREFVFCDSSSLKSVRTASETILSILETRVGGPPRINFLVFSAGFANLFRSFDTEDGLDLQLMMRYYHRFKMAYELMPLLRNARDHGQDAKFLSILASGMNFPVNPDDFGFKHLGTFGRVFKGVISAWASAAYNDLLIEEFASRERGISFTHSYPGQVRTAQLDFSFRKHWLFTPFRPFYDMLEKAVTVSSEECAEWMLFGLLKANTEGNGFYRRGNQGQELKTDGYDKPKRMLLRERLFQHSISETQGQEISLSK